VTAPKRRRERLALRVAKGCLTPADSATQSRMREKGYKVGDLVFAELTKPRSPGFHRLVHRIGSLCAQNIDSFSGMDAHKVLKRLQWEANIGCEEIGVQVPGVGLAMMRWPLSLGYESMEQGEFQEVARQFCRHIAATYWKGMTEDEIAEMAESMVQE
jgi:hypothetical protein